MDELRQKVQDCYEALAPFTRGAVSAICNTLNLVLTKMDGLSPDIVEMVDAELAKRKPKKGKKK